MPLEKCGKCNSDITQPKETIKCTDCSSIFHLACSRSASGDSGKRVSTRTNYKCEGCVSENSSTSSKIGPDRDMTAVLDAIAELRKENANSFEVVRRENSEMWLQTQQKIEKVETDIKLVTNDLYEVKTQFGILKQTVSKTEENVSQLEENNLVLREQIKELKEEINDLQQYSRIDNIIITGIPLTKGENIYNILSDIANVLRINYNRYDISAAHRLSAQIVRGRSPAIVVKFATRSIKADWMYARKEKKILRANDIHKSFPDSTVYFNEHMTALTRDIFNKGRQLVKENKLAFVWISDGRVLVKQTPTGKTIRVREVSAMERLAIRSSPSGQTAAATASYESYAAATAANTASTVQPLALMVSAVPTPTKATEETSA